MSLGFVRPENTQTYLEFADELETARDKLASLVLAGELGYSEIPVDDARLAMKGLERVLDGLSKLSTAEDAA